MGGLHDALRSTGLVTLFKGQVLWFASLWLSVFLTVAMALHFRSLEKAVIEARDVFERFVPPAYLRRIAAEGLGSIRLGEADRQSVTILSCDIRGFTSLSEELDPSQLVAFVNRLFERFIKIVDVREGVIDKFLGDAVLCIFEGTASARRAVACGVDLLSAVKGFNEDEERPGGRRIRVGIGLHSGPVILGTIGSSERMDSTVMGLTVNLAKRLEGLTKQFGVDMLISQPVADQLSNGHPHRLRRLGEVLIRGSSTSMMISEVFDHDPLDIRTLKDRAAPMMTEGISLCKAGHFQAALSILCKTQSFFPQDQPLRLLVTHLKRAIELGEISKETSFLDFREGK